MKKMSAQITREDLQKLYYENNVEDAAKKLGISTSCLFKYVNELKIPHKGRGGNKKRKLWIIG